MDNRSIKDCCRLCGFVFLDKKRKRNITGDFANIFESVCGQKAAKSDLPGAVCGTCKYRVEREWRKSSFTEDLKRKHPVSPLTSSQGHEQTFYRIEHKKPGQCLAFELVDTNVSFNVVQPISVPEVPVEPSDLQQIKTTRKASCQTDKAGCHYWQSKAEKGTSVKVGTGQPISATIVA